MKIRPFFSIKNNMAFNIRIYSAADFDNESIPMQEEDVAFISGFEARNTQNVLHPNRPISSAIPELYIHETKDSGHCLFKDFPNNKTHMYYSNYFCSNYYYSSPFPVLCTSY